jgi:hypothetical protein
MSRFTVTPLPLSGLNRIERQRLRDNRGYLTRIFCAQDLASIGWKKPIAQINHTYTAKCGTVRGLHFQYPPHTEMKLVNCLRGEVWDVAVDLRVGSPTFLQWHAEVLSADNGAALLERLAALPSVSMNPEPPGTLNGFWMPTVVFSKESGITREKLVAAFQEADIDARVFFWPLSSLPMFPPRPDNHVAWDIPGRAFNLPSYHEMTSKDISRVVEILHNVTSTVRA